MGRTRSSEDVSRHVSAALDLIDVNRYSMSMDADKVNIGFAIEDRIHTMSMTPDMARQMGAGLIREADVVEMRPPLTERIKARWRAGGERDRSNTLVGFSIGAAFFWAASDWEWHWWAFAAQVTLGAVAGIVRVWRDGNDELDELREKYHGSVDDDTGQLPWEVLR